MSIVFDEVVTTLDGVFVIVETATSGFRPPRLINLKSSKKTC